jgi:hypothetical protein
VNVTTPIAALALAVGATDPPAGKSGSARIAAVERELCLSTCPPLQPGVSSDWLRSPEGQKVNACHTGCRLEQPAASLFQSACDVASSNPFNPNTLLARLAGKDGNDLARRLRGALKDSEGKKPTALCARARASVEPGDEATYLECVGRIVPQDGATTVALPEAARALRCATTFAERDAEWLRRCPAVETTAFDACLERVDSAPRPRHQGSADAKAECESETVEKIAAAFRRKSRP